MKKSIFFVVFFMALLARGQDEYWTSYNFVVAPQDVSAVLELTDTYYTEHKADGVSVRLFENHFKDNGNNYTHCIVFSGSLDALGGMYGSGPNPSFDLFLTRLNQHTKEGYSSSMGRGIASYVGGDGPFPFRRMFLIRAEDPEAFAKSFNDFNSKHNPVGRMIFLGAISAGRSSAGETHFIVTGFKDFKAAMGGVSKLVPENQSDAFSKAWNESKENDGSSQMISSSMRILLGEW